MSKGCRKIGHQCKFTGDSDMIDDGCILHNSQNRCYGKESFFEWMKMNGESKEDSEEVFGQFVKNGIIVNERLVSDWISFINPIKPSNFLKNITERFITPIKIYHVRTTGDGNCFYHAILGCLTDYQKSSSTIVLQFKKILSDEVNVEDIGDLPIFYDRVEDYLDQYEGSSKLQLNRFLTKNGIDKKSKLSVEICLELVKFSIYKDSFWAHELEFSIVAKMFESRDRAQKILNDLVIHIGPERLRYNGNFNIVVFDNNDGSRTRSGPRKKGFYSTTKPINDQIPIVTIYSQRQNHFESVYYTKSDTDGDKINPIWHVNDEEFKELVRLYRQDPREEPSDSSRSFSSTSVSSGDSSRSFSSTSVSGSDASRSGRSFSSKGTATTSSGSSTRVSGIDASLSDSDDLYIDY